MTDFLCTSFALGSSDAIPVGALTSPCRSAACCARIRDGLCTGWCRLPDQHEGDHDGVLSIPTNVSTYGPRSKR